jgi:hypothetical protein
LAWLRLRLRPYTKEPLTWHRYMQDSATQSHAVGNMQVASLDGEIKSAKAQLSNTEAARAQERCASSMFMLPGFYFVLQKLCTSSRSELSSVYTDAVKAVYVPDQPDWTTWPARKPSTTSAIQLLMWRTACFLISGGMSSPAIRRRLKYLLSV